MSATSTERAPAAPRRIVRRIRAAFGHPGFPPAPFYAFEHALRVALGDEVAHPAPRFLRAIDRARAVARAAFAASPRLTAVVSYVAAERRPPEVAASLRGMERLGFPHRLGRGERVRLRDAEHIALFGEDVCHYWHAAAFDNDPVQVDALLWAGIAREIPIEPRVRRAQFVYVVDFERRLALHVYDDRGLDVFAMEREPIRELYASFGDWLLDHDRERMDARFGSASPGDGSDRV